MSEGVEWALHCCLVLGWLEDDSPVSTAKLASTFELSPTYLNKFLQALVRAGVLSSTAGVKGGFRLARSPGRISLLDVVNAIEGPDEAFRCTEIRQCGAGATAPPGTFARPCGILLAMRKAEAAWRRELEAQTIADMMAAAPPSAASRVRGWHGSR